MSDTASVATEPETLLGAPVTYSRGEKTVHVGVDGYVKLVGALKKSGYNFCTDVTSVDYLTNEARDLPPGVAPERYELVANLLSHSERARLRVRVQISADRPKAPSLYDLYPGVEAMEREVYDLMGIEFEGHPDLSRILLPDGWVGHPLRKDDPMGRIPVQFKNAPQPR